MHVTRGRAFSAFLALSLAGCSGGSSTPIVAARVFPAPTAVATVTAADPNSATTLKMSVVVPAPATSSARSRRPAYVSPATNSLSVEQDGGTPQVVSLVASSSQCALVSGVRTCQAVITVTAAANSRFVFKTYASADGSGTPLSVQNLVATIVAGQSNVIDVTLNGVVASLAVSLASASLTTGVPATDDVIVSALDASGDTIVGPGVYVDASGNPLTISLSDSDTSGATRLSQTSISSPTTLTLSYTGAATASSVTISAEAASLPIAATSLAIARAGAMTNAQRNAAISQVGPLFDALPHHDKTADLATLAAAMLASGNFMLAEPEDGGIAAMLADGTPITIFADKNEDLPYGGAAAAASVRRSAGSVRRIASGVPPSAQHEVSFLENESGDSAFNPTYTADFDDAFDNSGFQANSYQTDITDVELGSMIALGANRSFDFLSITTHGAFGYPVSLPSQASAPPSTAHVFGWLSDTPTSDANVALYASDLTAGNLIYGYSLATGPVRLPQFVFDAGFLAAHLTFNQGAILDNQACFGGSSAALSGPQGIATVLGAVGVERFFGWPESVLTADGYSTDAFLFDRMLGEQVPSQTGLDRYIAPATPPIVPVGLDAIYTQMTKTLRADQISRQTYTYAQTPLENSDGSPSTTQVTNFAFYDTGISNFALRPVEWQLPAISLLTLNAGTLRLSGAYPITEGTVTITDPDGTPHVLQPTSWNANVVMAAVPSSGPGSSGVIHVVSATGIAGNPVTLTTFNLTPSAVNLDYGAKQTFTMAVSPPSTALTYTWQLNGGAGGRTGGVLSDPLSSSTNSFTTSSNAAVYTAPTPADPNDPQPSAAFDTVTVTVLQQVSTGTTPIGTFTSQIGVGCDMVAAGSSVTHRKAIEVCL